MNELGKKIDELSNQLTQLRLEIWRKYTLFTWQWWTFVAVCIIFTILFFVLVNRKKYVQTIAYFGLIYIINRNLDDIATIFDLYDYRMQLEPVIPTMLPANLFVIPISFSIIYQRYDKWRSFMIASIIFSILVSYIALPLAKTVHIYLEKSWNAHLSFISLILMSIVCKLLVDSVISVQKKSLKEQ